MKRTGPAKAVSKVEVVSDGLIYSTQPDAYVSRNQSKATYYTTYSLAKDLAEWQESSKYEGNRPYPEQILKWCKTWFGSIPKERIGGRARGYRIPLEYRYVARAWRLIENTEVREVAKKVLLVDPKPWLLVVGKHGSTHYNMEAVLERLRQLGPTIRSQHTVTYIVNVGPIREKKKK
jgi:hypothetical protein